LHIFDNIKVLWNVRYSFNWSGVPL